MSLALRAIALDNGSGANLSLAIHLLELMEPLNNAPGQPEVATLTFEDVELHRVEKLGYVLCRVGRFTEAQKWYTAALQYTGDERAHWRARGGRALATWLEDPSAPAAWRSEEELQAIVNASVGREDLTSMGALLEGFSSGYVPEAPGQWTTSRSISISADNPAWMGERGEQIKASRAVRSPTNALASFARLAGIAFTGAETRPVIDPSLKVRDGDLYIGGRPVAEIARACGTPVYVYQAEALDSRLRTLVRELPVPSFRLLYSLKANPSVQVIQECIRAGLDVDACSPGDVHLARVAGVPAARISYTGVGLDEREIEALAQARIHMNLDSLQEVISWARVAPGQAVGIRCVPGIVAGFHPHTQAGTRGGKFGIPSEDIPIAISALRDADCPVRTLHVHLGSSIDSVEPHLAALDFLLALAVDLPSVDAVNLGGGLAARYHPLDQDFPLAALRAGCLARLARFERATQRRLQVELEPGEFIVSEAGWLLCQVRVTKGSVAIVDASANHLPAPMLYGSYVHIYADGKETDDVERSEWDVYGNTNQAGDRFASRRLLPRLEPGDLLLLRNAGAYAFSRSTRFNERPRPAEVWVERGEIRVIRLAEGLDQ